MYSLGIQNNFNNSILKIKSEDNKSTSPISNAVIHKPTKQPSFRAALPPTALRTELVSQDEKQKYSQISSLLDKEGKKNLDLILKNGRLLNSDSNDKSTTLDNLSRIITIPRAEGLDTKMVLKETVATIANPYVITQQFGDIPQQYVQKALEQGHKNEIKSDNLIEKEKIKSTTPPNEEINEQTINVEHSGACVAASIEFNLAQQMPAEFARFAADLSSKDVAVKKNIKIDNLANNALDAIWLLNAFEVPYQMNDFKEAKLTLAPDKNALLRAQIQNSNKDPLERSLVDALMQSTFMNVGSQQSYNSLTDVRKGKFNQNDRGLIEFEKTFTESVVEDKNKVSVTYQVVDDNAKLVGYETDFATMKKHILDSLAMGENVIIGYTQVDDTNTIINGHEITIVGARADANGKLIFTCNDTDDNNPKPIEYKEDYIIPKIHHAGLPQKVVEKDVQFVDNWKQGLEAYKQAKNQPQPEQTAQSQQTHI